MQLPGEDEGASPDGPRNADSIALMWEDDDQESSAAEGDMPDEDACATAALTHDAVFAGQPPDHVAYTYSQEQIKEGLEKIIALLQRQDKLGLLDIIRVGGTISSMSSILASVSFYIDMR